MSDDHRKQLAEHGPDWIPDYLEQRADNDPVLQAAFKRLRKNLDPEVWARFEKYLWYWETSIKDERGNNIVLPMYFPPDIASLNFWNTITDEEDGFKKCKDKVEEKDGRLVVIDGDPSVWDKLCAGEKMSELDWVNPVDQALYRWMVTIGQTVRFITVMTEQPERANMEQFNSFFAHEERINEFVKRTDLGVRDEKKDKETLVMALIPLLVVLKMAREFRVLGPEGKDQEYRSNWGADLALWMERMAQIPDKKDADAVEGYGKGMASLTEFYFTLIARLTNQWGKEQSEVAQDMYTRLKKSAKEDAKLTTATRLPRVMPRRGE